jgi:hypothetical protein
MRSHSLNLLTANCLQQRFAIAPLQLPQTSFFNEPQRHRGHREREIAPLNLPNSDRTPSTSQTAIAPLNSQTAIASPQLPKQRSHPLNSPISFFNEPRRHEEHEGRREEKSDRNFPQISMFFKQRHNCMK